MTHGARCSPGSPRSPTTRRPSSSSCVRPAGDAGLSQTGRSRRGWAPSQSAVARLERGDADVPPVDAAALRRGTRPARRASASSTRADLGGAADDEAAELAGRLPVPVPAASGPMPERRDPVVVPIVYEPLRPDCSSCTSRRTVLLGGPLDAADGDAGRRRADEPRRRSSRRAARSTAPAARSPRSSPCSTSSR